MDPYQRLPESGPGVSVADRNYSRRGSRTNRLRYPRPRQYPVPTYLAPPPGFSRSYSAPPTSSLRGPLPFTHRMDHPHQSWYRGQLYQAPPPGFGSGYSAPPPEYATPSPGPSRHVTGHATPTPGPFGYVPGPVYTGEGSMQHSGYGYEGPRVGGFERFPPMVSRPDDTSDSD